MSYILFYSDECPHSKKFIHYLQQYQLTFFQVVNVATAQSLPNYIHSVPSIIVPDFDQPLVGGQVFQWLEQFLQQHSSSEQQTQQQTQQQYQQQSQQHYQQQSQQQSQQLSQQQLISRNMPSQAQAQPPPQSSMEGDTLGVSPFSQDLSSNLSDKFSYLDNKEIIHNYHYLNSDHDELPNYKDSIGYSNDQSQSMPVSSQPQASFQQRSSQGNSRQSEKINQFNQEYEQFQKERAELSQGIQTQRR